MQTFSNFLRYFPIFQNIETFNTYYGKDLKHQTLKTKRNTATFYFLSNDVVLEAGRNPLGFNCTYVFV